MTRPRVSFTGDHPNCVRERMAALAPLPLNAEMPPPNEMVGLGREAAMPEDREEEF